VVTGSGLKRLNKYFLAKPINEETKVNLATNLCFFTAFKNDSSVSHDVMILTSGMTVI
jgi:hypothetical protein